MQTGEDNLCAKEAAEQGGQGSAGNQTRRELRSPRLLGRFWAPLQALGFLQESAAAAQLGLVSK